MFVSWGKRSLIESLIEGECWYLGLGKRMCTAAKTYRTSPPLFGVGCSCFACLKQTTTSVFSWCFVCVLKRKIEVSAKRKITLVLFSWTSWWHERVIGWKKQGRREDGEQIGWSHVWGEKVLKGGKHDQCVWGSICAHTYMIQHRRIEFPWEWKHQDISVRFSWNTLRFTHQIRTFKAFSYFPLFRHYVIHSNCYQTLTAFLPEEWVKFKEYMSN